MTTRSELMLQIVASMDAQDFLHLTEAISPRMQAHVGGQDLSFEGWRAMGEMFYSAFPDGRHQAELVLDAGPDSAVFVGRFVGTHRGDFQGIPPTGRAIDIGVIMVDRFADGRVVEHSGQFDALGLLQQLGVAPAPA